MNKSLINYKKLRQWGALTALVISLVLAPVFFFLHRVEAAVLQNCIKNLSVSGQEGPTAVQVGRNRVTFHMPHGSDMTALIPTIEVSEGATINPPSGTAQNFTNPVKYTVRSSTGVVQEWTVVCVVNHPTITGRYYDIGTPMLKDVWVDSIRGNDANDGTARNRAKRTITAVWNTIPRDQLLQTTGYRILLCPGTYRGDYEIPGWMERRYGTYECPIIFQAADGLGTVTFSPGEYDDCRYLYFIDLNFWQEYGSSIHPAQCDHLYFKNCVFRVGSMDVQENIKLNQCYHIYMENCEVNTGYHLLDYMACQWGHIKDSRFLNGADWAIYLKGGSGYFDVDGNEVRHVRLGITAGESCGFHYMVSPWIHYQAHDIKFTNNTVSDCQVAGLAVEGGHNILFAYNTVHNVGYDNGNCLNIFAGSQNHDAGDTSARDIVDTYNNWGGWGIAEQRIYAPNRNVYFYNNVIVTPSLMWNWFYISGAIANPTGSQAPSGVLADNTVLFKGNILFRGHQGGLGDLRDDNPTLNQTLVRAENYIEAIYPEFVNLNNEDFHPINGGNLHGLPYVAIPDFPIDGYQSLLPKESPGNLTNIVPFDKDGLSRTLFVPGAYFSENGNANAFTVTITNPVNNTQFTAPATVNIMANASDNDGTISKVEFYSGNTRLGEDTMAPYTFSWTQVLAGNYSLTAIATDDEGHTARSLPVGITVTAPGANRPPVIASIGHKTVNVGSTLTFTVTATDADGDSLVYSASNLPTGASFNALSHEFSWTPGQDQLGNHEVTLGVFDGEETVRERVVIAVTASAPQRQGLTGYYYDSAEFKNLRMIRNDNTIDFNWTGITPHACMSPTTFSVRWVGQIRPLYSETYTFHVTSDDRARLWIDGKLIVDAWTSHTARTHRGRVRLQAGRSYKIRLDYYQYTGAGVVGLQWSSPSQTLQIVPANLLSPKLENTPPTPPMHVRVGNATSSSLELMWDANGVGTDKYRIYAGKTSEVTPSTKFLVGEVANNTFVHANLRANTYYYYRISAVDAGNKESPATTLLKLRTLPITGPINVRANNITTHSMDLTWDASDTHAVKYRVYASRSKDFIPSSKNLLGEATDPTFGCSKLRANSIYYFRISAVDVAGNESTKTGFKTKTLAVTPSVNVRVRLVTGNSVELSWDNNDVHVTKYRIYYSRSADFTSSSKTQLGEVKGTNFRCSNLRVNTAYYFRIGAVDAEGNESAKTKPIKVWTNAVVGTQWYIDNAAIGANNGTSWTDAWTSFAAVVWGDGGVKPGDVVHISGGPTGTQKTYGETLKVDFPWNATIPTAKTPIVIRVGQETGHNGTIVITSLESHGIHIQSVPYLRIDGEVNGSPHIRVTACHGDGVNIASASHHVVLSHLEVDHNGYVKGDNGIYINYSSTVANEKPILTIEHCRIHDNYQDQVHLSGTRGPNEFGRVIVRNCEIFGLHDDGIECGVQGLDFYNNLMHTFNGHHSLSDHPDGIVVAAGYSRIFNNILRNLSKSGDTFGNNLYAGFYTPTPVDVSHVYFFNNLVYHDAPAQEGDFGNKGFEMTAKHSKSISHILIANNTFVGTPGLALSIAFSELNASRLSDIKIVNNIIVNCGRSVSGFISMEGDSGFQNWTTGSWGKNVDVILDYNLIALGADGHLNGRFKGTWGNYDQLMTLAGFQKHFIGNPDPLLDRDGKPRSSSPALNRGVDLSSLAFLEIQRDLDGILRPRRAWDIGAYEAQNIK